MTNFQNNEEVQKNTKNDTAWEMLFDKYSILEALKTNSYFEITSQEINEFRESRLMAKFDHKVQLPKIFKQHQLSILPITRSRYVIGRFDTHLKVNYNQTINSVKVNFPNSIKSIDYSNITSESIALNCAFNAGIIADLLSVDISECYHTLSGRMSTQEFDFEIRSLVTSENEKIFVNNSQCEIDAGYETKDSLLIVEAKNLVEDFVVRQLYYPYRLWKKKFNQDGVTKNIIPVLMTYSNNLFNFFIYEFENDLNYNSIELVKQLNYQILPEKISTEDVSDLFYQIQIQTELENVPFPQADLFPRVIDLVSVLKYKKLTKLEISNYYQFDRRQADYYFNAGRYLGLLELNELKYITLTDEAITIFSYSYKQKILSLIRKILEHQIFYEVFKISLDNGEIPTQQQIQSIMLDSNLNLNPTSIARRARTIRRWLEWIWQQIEID